MKTCALLISILALLALNSCRQESVQKGEEKSEAYWIVAITTNEAKAYKTYYTQEAQSARAVLTDYCKFLDTTPDQAGTRKLRLTGKALAMARIQFIDWYLSKAKIDLTPAAEILKSAHETQNSEKNISEFRKALVVMIANGDKDQVRWVTSESIASATK